MDLGYLFKNYTKEAFRLETLSQYSVDGEKENFEHYLKTGEALQDVNLKEYLKDVETKIILGATNKRVRVLNEPINDYQIFETKVGYIPQAKLGADIRFINFSDYNKIIKTYDSKIDVKDFWLFDEKHLAIMIYKNDGSWDGYELIEEADIVNVFVNLKNTLLDNSYNLDVVLNLIHLSLNDY